MSDPFVSYTVGATPQSTFVVPFQFWADTELFVMFNDVSQLFTTTGVTEPTGGTVILTTPVSNGELTIQRLVPETRYSSFPVNGPFRIETLNDELDRLIAMISDRRYVNQEADVIWDDIVGKPANLMTLDDVYPIGSVYISVNGVLPPLGNWQKLQDGQFLLNDHANLGDTGGAATHTLTESEMPSHTHTSSSDGNHEHDVQGEYIGGRGVSTGAAPLVQAGAGYTNANKTWGAGVHQHINSNTGGGAAHNNMPPYLKVSMWERIS